MIATTIFDSLFLSNPAVSGSSSAKESCSTGSYAYHSQSLHLLREMALGKMDLFSVSRPSPMLQLLSFLPMWS